VIETVSLLHYREATPHTGSELLAVKMRLKQTKKKTWRKNRKKYCASFHI